MILSLDYDYTYTEDPVFWDAFIQLAKKHGHKVICVTLRMEDELNDIAPNFLREVPIFCTARKPKLPYTLSRGLKVDIWIDDSPQWLLYGVGMTYEEYEKKPGG